jgi:hypothetical protein
MKEKLNMLDKWYGKDMIRVYSKEEEKVVYHTKLKL